MEHHLGSVTLVSEKVKSSLPAALWKPNPNHNGTSGSPAHYHSGSLFSRIDCSRVDQTSFFWPLDVSWVAYNPTVCDHKRSGWRLSGN